MKIKIVHIATGLGMGGAENSLVNLLAFTNLSEFEPIVLSLSNIHPIGERIRSLGIQVESLGMHPGSITQVDLYRLTRFLRTAKPDLIQTWMYHADLLGGLTALLIGKPPVVWGIHLTVDDMHGIKRSTRAVIRLNALLSHCLPASIVCCAEKTRLSHIAAGYDGSKMKVIPNGIDLSVFQPDPSACLAVRAELGVSPETRLVGMAARFHPHKDHGNFISAAALLHDEMPKVHFILWGNGINWENRILSGWIDAVGLRDQFHLLDLRLDAPRLTAALDIASLSSISEAFPMAVGEAMACGIPCVVTDVGDAADMIADTGRAVPPGNALDLSHAWRELLDLPEQQYSLLGQRARQRVMERYDIQNTSQQYANLYKDIISSRHHR